MNPDFTIILPIYNQQDHVKVLLDDYSKALNDSGFSWELIFVINGSNDNSFDIAKQNAISQVNVHVFNINGSGWGRAVKFGIEKSTGKYICYTNSARTKVSDLINILKYATVNKDVIVKANRIIRESFIRRLGSVIYNFENRFFFKTPVWDVNGTPKVFPASILKSYDIWNDNDLIDAELIAKSFRDGHSIIEIPVRFTDRISGKSTTNLLSAFKMYIGLVKLYNKFNGK